MKKLLLTLCTLALLACSKGDDDNKIVYDETKGYLTNLESVKHGIVGTWKIEFNNTECNNSYLQWVFNKNGKCNYKINTDCVNINQNKTIIGEYVVLEENGKFYVKLDENFLEVFQDPSALRQEITILTKTTLNLDNVMNNFTRQ